MRQSPSSQAGRFSSAPLTPLPRSGFVQSAGTVRLRGAAPREERISVDAAAQRLGICVGSVHRLIRQGVLPAEQIDPPPLEWSILKYGFQAEGGSRCTVLHGSGSRAHWPLPRPESSGADVLRASERQHAVEGVDTDI